jgi:hypothetical protein
MLDRRSLVVIATLLMAAGPGAGSARGASGRWSPRDYQAHQSDPTVWAKDATASGVYDNFRYAAEFATGAPNVFPRYGRNEQQWLPANKRGVAWLELTFPPTMARQVRIFETNAAGTIREVIDLTTGEQAIFSTTDAPAKFSEGQVLWIDLGATRRVEKLKIVVDATPVEDWPGIDAVGLVGEKLPDPNAGLQGHWSPADLARQPEAPIVWASAAKASGQYDAFRYAVTFAVGKPDVFPKLGDQPNAWKTSSRASGQWIELTFPKTNARQVRIYETQAPGSVKKVIDVTSGEHVLYEFPDKKSPAFTEAQVLFVTLRSPRPIEKVKLLIDPALSGGWPQIDAVGLVPAE